MALRPTQTLIALAPRPSLCSCVHSCDTLDMLRPFGCRRPIPCFRAPDDKYTNSLKVASCGKDCLRSHQLSSSFQWCCGHSDKEETSTWGESFFLFLSFCCSIICADLRGTAPAPLVPASLPPATPKIYSVSRPRPLRSTGGDLRSLEGCHPKETLHCCRVTLVCSVMPVLIHHTQDTTTMPLTDDNVS